MHWCQKTPFEPFPRSVLQSVFLSSKPSWSSSQWNSGFKTRKKHIWSIQKNKIPTQSKEPFFSHKHAFLPCLVFQQKHHNYPLRLNRLVRNKQWTVSVILLQHIYYLCSPWFCLTGWGGKKKYLSTETFNSERFRNKKVFRQLTWADYAFGITLCTNVLHFMNWIKQMPGHQIH